MGENVSDEIGHLQHAVEKLTDSVNGHKTALARQIGELTTSVDFQKTATAEISRKVDDIAKNQAECSAKNGFKGVNARLKAVEKASSDTRILVEQTREPRADTTGSLDEVALQMARVANEQARVNSEGIRGLNLKGFMKTFGPWIAMILFGVGVYFGSGGDEKKMIDALEAVNKIVQKVDSLETKIKTDSSEITLRGEED